MGSVTNLITKVHALNLFAIMYTGALNATTTIQLSIAQLVAVGLPTRQGKGTIPFGMLHSNMPLMPSPKPSPLDRTDHSLDLWSLGKTPIITSAIAQYLTDYPDKLSASILDFGFKHGFKLLYTGPRSSVFSNNLISANQHGDII